MKTIFLGQILGIVGLGIIGCSSGTTSQATQAQTASTTAANSNTNTGLYLDLSSTTTAPGGTITLQGSGGTSPYTYSLYSGVGSLTGNTYSAGNSTGSATVKVTDAAGNAAYSSITISNSITLTLSATSISTGGTSNLSASGGTSPYTFTVPSSEGSISGAVYTAPSYATTAQITVTDANGYETSASLTVTYETAIQISPSAITLYTGSTQAFTATGGDGSYTFQLISGGGTLGSQTYTAPSSAQTAKIEVWDSSGHSAIASVSVIVAKKLNKVTNLTLDDSAMITFVMPSDTSLYPAFVVGGAGPSGDFGRNVNKSNGADTTSFAAAPASTAVSLSNYNWDDSYPYVGTLIISGRGGTDTFNFCINSGDTTAYLEKVSASQSISVTYKSTEFSSLAANTPGGFNLEGIWIVHLDPQSGAGTATFEIVAGIHNHSITNCSAYTNFSLSSASDE